MALLCKQSVRMLIARKNFAVSRMLCFLILLDTANALHHMKRPPLAYVSRRAQTVPLVIKSLCSETIYPGIVTQAGTAPSTGGFELQTGQQMNLTVGADWQGRVWGRTNCSFNLQGTGPANAGGNNGGGSACGTGDCGGIINCKATGETPVTLAEFTLATSTGQTFYDISLVDGYNLPLAIVSLYPESGNASLTKIPPNLTNPICIGTAALLTAQGDTSDSNSGTNSSYPIPLDESVSVSDVASWCPWDLQVNIPTVPSDGVYSYPDTNIQRPGFDPCFSACAKYSHASDCCTGSYDSPNACKPSSYSTAAKSVCPDAYSYAFDDQTSTFIIPSGGGFEVTFCPTGRSSNILKVYKQQLSQLSQTGSVSESLLEAMQVT